MPHNGEVNKRFGVYKNLCCDFEIVVNKGSTFPDCPKHPRLTTEWRPLAELDKEIPHVSELKAKKKRMETHLKPTKSVTCHSGTSFRCKFSIVYRPCAVYAS